MSSISLFERQYIHDISAVCYNQGCDHSHKDLCLRVSAAVLRTRYVKCACLAGFLASADERLAPDKSDIDTVRVPSRMLAEGFVRGAPIAQCAAAVKTASDITLT